jgi:hypothetical protein
MMNLGNHATRFRRVLAFDDLLHAAESQPSNRLSHVAGTANEAAHPLDFSVPVPDAFFVVVIGQCAGLGNDRFLRCPTSARLRHLRSIL